MSATPPEQPPNEPDPPRKTPRRRRWFQFGLGTLLVLVALCAVLLAAWRVYLAPYRAQRETMALIERLKGSYQTQAAATWAARLSLAPTHNVVLVNLPDCDEPAEYLDAVSRLPCLETLVVGGLAFGDEHLARLQTLPTLRWLVLDSTNVSAAAEKALQKALPNLQLRHSDRRILAGFEARGAEFGSKVSNSSQELLQLVGPEFMESDTHLFFEGGEITDTDLARLGRTFNVSVVDISAAPITDAGLAQLSKLTELKSLYILHTPITDAGLAHFEGLSKLQYLFLGHTQVTDAGVAKLRQALPNCNIFPGARVEKR